MGRGDTSMFKTHTGGITFCYSNKSITLLFAMLISHNIVQIYQLIYCGGGVPNKWRYVKGLLHVKRILSPFTIIMNTPYI